MDTRHTVYKLFLAALLGLGAWACTSVEAPTKAASTPASSGLLKEFLPYHEHLVEVNGLDVKEGRIYRSVDPPAFLVLSPNFDNPAVLYPVSNTVKSIELSVLTEEKDVRVTVKSGYKTWGEGVFTVTDGVNFEHEGHSVRLKPKPILLKAHTSDELRAYDPGYGQRADAYSVDSALLGRIKSSSKSAKVTVYFGSWCQFCQRYVPHLMKLEQELAGSNIEFSYFGLPNDFTQEPETDRMKIERVPTAIVTVAGREIGRLVGRECQQPELKLSRILAH